MEINSGLLLPACQETRRGRSRPVKEGVDKATAEEIRAKLADVGADVEVA